MTSVGKLLVLVNLVMSIFFMSFAVMVSTAREDVQKKLESQAEKLAAAQKAKQEAETAQASAETQIAEQKQTLETEIDTLKGDIARLTQQTQALDAQLKQARDESSQAAAALQTATIEQTQRQEEVEDLRKTRDQLLKEKSDLVTVKTELQDELSQIKNDKELLTERLQEVNTKLQQYSSWIVRNNGVLPTQNELEDEGDLPPPPDVEGKVTEVDDTGRFIQLSIGSDDGLRAGHELLVWRTTPNPQYMGKIRIFTVHPRTAVAQPINQKGLIRKDDKVGPRIRK